MKITEALKARRSYYAINRELPVAIDRVMDMVKELTELVPDAFNMKSSRAAVVHGEKQDQLWNKIYDVFEGKVAREKIDSFRAGSGTILYFYDRKVVESLQKQYPLYADNFPVWASQSSAMLQLAVWSGLRELNIGASAALQSGNRQCGERTPAPFGGLRAGGRDAFWRDCRRTSAKRQRRN